MNALSLAALVACASAPYRACGAATWHFARGKLRHDPVYPALLQSGLFTGARQVLDLGCGRALLAHWLDAALQLQQDDAWPTPWPRLESTPAYRGIERDAGTVARVAATLPNWAQVAQGDLRDAPLMRADRIVLLDVLHYLEPDAQARLLDRVRAALSDDGVLILRVGNADAGWRHRLADWTDRLVLLGSGHGLPRLHARPLADWLEALAQRGLAVEPSPMSEGTPFANVLLVARPCHSQTKGGDALC